MMCVDILSVLACSPASYNFFASPALSSHTIVSVHLLPCLTSLSCPACLVISRHCFSPCLVSYPSPSSQGVPRYLLLQVCSQPWLLPTAPSSSAQLLLFPPTATPPASPAPTGHAASGPPAIPAAATAVVLSCSNGGPSGGPSGGPKSASSVAIAELDFDHLFGRQPFSSSLKLPLTPQLQEQAAIEAANLAGRSSSGELMTNDDGGGNTDGCSGADSCLR